MIKLSDIENAIEKYGKYWIVFLGDSITNASGIHPNWREIISDTLAEKLGSDNFGLRFFNFGVDGSTSKTLLANIATINDLNPDLVLLMAGVNDPYFGVDIKNHTKNIKAIADCLGNKLIFSTNPFPVNIKIQSDYQKYVSEDIKLKLPNFINLFELSKSFPNKEIYTYKSEAIPEMKIKEGDPDGLHPNILGNAYIAKIILKEVFGIEFDPEKCWQYTLEGEKMPKY